MQTNNFTLKGKRTYIVALVMILYAITGYLLQDLSQQQAFMIFLNALGFAGLRSGVAQLGEI